MLRATQAKMRSLKFWPNQWLYLAFFIVTMDAVMTVRKFYFINVICSGAFSIIFADICVKAYELFLYKRKFIEDTKNKAVMVTGCDTGFGFLFAQKLAKMGFLVYATVLNPTGEGAKTLKTVDNIVVVSLDVTDQSSVDKVVEFVKGDLKRKDRTFWSLVNNAGIAVYCDVEFASLEHYQKIMDVNTLGVVRMCKGFLPLLRAAGEGRIVNISSISRRNALPSMTAYSMSKSALNAFANILRLELKPWNISVHNIEPYFYLTTPTIEDGMRRYRDDYLKLWHSGPAEVKQAYGESYREDFIKNLYKYAETRMRSKEDISEVIDDVVHAVAGIDPNALYTPSTFIKMMMEIAGFMPQELADYFVTLKMTELPAALKTAHLSARKHS